MGEGHVGGKGHVGVGEGYVGVGESLVGST